MNLKDSEIIDRAKSLATWPVRMMLPLSDQTKCVDTGGGVDKLLRGDQGVKVINRPHIMLGQKAFWHVNPVSRFLGGLQNKRILDVGCGVGYVGLLAALRGAIVVATEMHDQNILRAQLVFDSFGVNDRARVIKSDMQSMSVEELGVFDAVLFLGTIYHCEYPLQVLENISKMSSVVVVDARLASEEQVNDYLYDLRFFREVYSDDNPFSSIRRVGGGVIRKPTRDTLIKMLKIAGYQEIYQCMPLKNMQKHFQDEEFIQFIAFKDDYYDQA